MIRALVALALYVAAAVWLTWPLGAHAGDALHGASLFNATDALYSLWAMDWVSHSFVTAPWALADAPIYHPTPDAFFYGPSAFGGVPLFAPVVWATGNPVLATNVVFVGGVALLAWTTHLIVHRWTRSDLAAVVAAATILTNGWLVRGFVAATPHMAMLPYLPLLMWVAATPMTRLGRALRIVPLVVAQSLTDLVYVAPAVFAILGSIAALRLLRRTTRPAGLRLAAALALSAAVLAPIYAGYAAVRRDNPDLAQQSVYPTHAMYQILPGQFTNPNMGPAVFLPATLVLLALGAVAFAARRPNAEALVGWRHAALWTIVGVVLSLSPDVRWQGWHVPVPQMLFASVFTHLRVPARLGVVAMVGSAVLSGLSFAAIAGWTERLGRVAGVCARVLLAVVVVAALLAGAEPEKSFDIVTVRAPAEPILAAVRAIPGPVVELPVQFDFLQATAMYHSTLYRRPLLNGYSSYFPAAFPERMTLVRQLPDPTALARLRDETDLAGIWVHLDRMPPEARAAWVGPAAFLRRDLRRVALQGDDLVLWVVAPAR